MFGLVVEKSLSKESVAKEFREGKKRTLDCFEKTGREGRVIQRARRERATFFFRQPFK